MTLYQDCTTITVSVSALPHADMGVNIAQILSFHTVETLNKHNKFKKVSTIRFFISALMDDYTETKAGTCHALSHTYLGGK